MNETPKSKAEFLNHCQFERIRSSSSSCLNQRASCLRRWCCPTSLRPARSSRLAPTTGPIHKCLLSYATQLATRRASWLRNSKSIRSTGSNRNGATAQPCPVSMSLSLNGSNASGKPSAKFTMTNSLSAPCSCSTAPNHLIRRHRLTLMQVS